MFDDEDEEFTDVGTVHQIPNRRPHFVEVGGRDVILFRMDDRIVALSGKCTHASAPLSEGEVDGNEIRCLRHGARFDLTTGRSLTSLCRDLPRFEVRREGVRVLVKRERS
jgi:3-phenylpropionate/trans-cinnamate dioxygenase ferredoxin subunit